MADGVLAIDKPGGVTSHDVVQWARRALGERAVGHAGTLDPMATGVLVLLAGEATKLSAHLTAQSKVYEATVRFGEETDSLDADGVVTARVAEGSPMPTREAVERALALRMGPMEQVPPAVSAIKVGGVAMHERVRRGEEVTLAPRSVVLEAARVTAWSEGACSLELTCSKGFYVRSLARDLARDLGTLGTLTALRRTRSGAITVDACLDGERLRAAKADPGLREGVRGALVPIASLGRWMRALRVTDDEARELGFGRKVARDGDDDGTAVVLTGDGRPVCIGEVTGGVLRVVRGFNAG